MGENPTDDIAAFTDVIVEFGDETIVKFHNPIQLGWHFNEVSWNFHSKSDKYWNLGTVGGAAINGLNFTGSTPLQVAAAKVDVGLLGCRA